MLETLQAIPPLEWLFLVVAMLFGAFAHYAKKFSEAEARVESFSAKMYLLKHKWAVVSSSMMQIAGLVYLVEQGQAGIFSAILLGISAESASGWVRAKSKFKE